ncbi:MAG: sugar ABC transporter ATP-binding protein [Lachnospiraceae bacterium]|nr:sugar ABC transporter ATP-binding protein [Lachnospiraceae bacterium]
MGDVVFKVEHVSKSFPGVKVLDDINIEFRKGTVHAIVGENGAGKSTFMNIVYGVYQDYEGKLIWEDKEVKFDSPLEAQKMGIAMVHQENSLIPYLSVMDNIYLGHYPKKAGLIDKSKLRKQSTALMKELGIEGIDVNTKVVNLSVAQKQLVEIVKALSHDARLLMLDEPTAALTDKETEYLMKIIDELKKKDVAIIYVSHRLEEVFEVSDEISVLRDGCMIITIPKEKFNYDDVVFHMIGRKLEEFDVVGEDKRDLKNAPVELKVEHLSRRDELKDISFEVKKGEILGFGGLVGAGRSELLEAIFGYDPYTSGEVYIEGEKVHIRNTGEAIKLGLALVPEERKVKGIFATHSVMANINIASYKDLKNGRFINKRKEKKSAEEYVEKLSIKTETIKKLLSQLSGGNQQKVVVSRWLRTDPKILMLDEPTHGIDIGAKSDIYAIIRRLANEGTTILLISSEMQELIRLSDRVVVMREGVVQGFLNKDELSQDAIMRLAMGQQKLSANA